MILAGQVGLVRIPSQANHAARLADVNIVVGATEIIVTASSVQEGATNTDHDEPDGKRKKCGGSRAGTRIQCLVDVLGTKVHVYTTAH